MNANPELFTRMAAGLPRPALRELLRGHPEMMGELVKRVDPDVILGLLEGGGEDARDQTP